MITFTINMYKLLTFFNYLMRENLSPTKNFNCQDEK